MGAARAAAQPSIGVTRVGPARLRSNRAVSTTNDTGFFGHPRGLSTLFFTEMWERFSYYGMRALLVLFITAPVASGGLGFDLATAGAIYGLYTSMVYLTTLPRRLDRGPPDRRAERGALRRRPHRRRPLQHGGARRCRRSTSACS